MNDILSGSLQQQNLTVLHEFNLCHKLVRKILQKISPGSQHVTWRLSSDCTNLLLHNNSVDQLAWAQSPTIYNMG